MSAMSSVGLPDPAGLALMRSASLDSSRFSSPVTAPFAPESALHNIRAKVDIDYNVSTEGAGAGFSPASWSEYNVVFFPRQTRVYYKNMLSNSEEVAQLCKIKESCGTVSLIDSGGLDQPSTVALATSKGHIQIYDLVEKKMITTWHTAGVTAMKWNGKVLTVGGPRGAIRHYDTRVPNDKVKESAKRVTRHQSKISSMSWHFEGSCTLLEMKPDLCMCGT